MQHTTNYNLSQYDATDRVTRDAFNADNLAIDAALKSVSNAAGAAQSTANSALAAAAAGCRVVVGTYTGTGTYGRANPNTLTFDSAPLAVFISGKTTLCLLNGVTSVPSIMSGNGAVSYAGVSWSGSSVSWWSETSTSYQANLSGSTYCYLALFAAN